MADPATRDALIEALYYRHHGIYREPMGSIDEAVQILISGVDDRELADVGVFVDGKPRLTACSAADGPRAPTPAEAEQMSGDYRKATPA